MKFYGEKLSPPNSPTCQSCKLNCIKGGIELILTDNIDRVLICSELVCYSIGKPKEQESVFFPGEIMLQNHDFQVKIWSKGILIKQLGLQCPAQPFCESINCHFCVTRLANPQTPYTVLFILFIFLWFSSLTFFLLLKLLKYSTQIILMCFKSLINCCKFCYKRFKKKKGHAPRTHKSESNNTSNEDQPRSRQTRRNCFPRSQRGSLIVVYVAILSGLFHLGNGCSEATTMTGKSKTCNIPASDDPAFSFVKNCVFNEVTHLALVPQGQQTCLMIQKPNDEPLGVVWLQIERKTMRCQAKNQYFTRSFKIGVQASKRCSNTGSCTGDKCSKYDKNSKIEELDGQANNSPGFTFCHDSDACWGNECFYCTSACLFYRLFASPQTDTIFEVFKCPVWRFQVKAIIIVEGSSGKVTKHKVTLEPGIKIFWRNFDVTLIGIIAPPAPIVGSSCLTDGHRTAMIEASASGQPVPGTVGELQCSNRADAEKFNCYFPHNSCVCTPQAIKVQCTCTSLSLEPLFLNPEHVLPLTTQGITIQGIGTYMHAEFHSIASLEVQLSMKNFRLGYAMTQTSCHITPLEFSGCYSCLSGAHLNFLCKTDEGMALAHIFCGNEGRFATQCSSEGVKGETTMTFRHAQINVNCEVHCPEKTTFFKLNGTLIFIDKKRLSNISNIIAGKSPDAEMNTSDIDFFHIFNWMKSNWVYIILIVLLLIIIIPVSIVLLPKVIIFLVLKSI